jgi:ATP-binding cassette subfamily C protein
MADARRSLAGPLTELVTDFARFAGPHRLAAAIAVIVAGAVFEGAGIILLVQVMQALLNPGGAPTAFPSLARAGQRALAGIDPDAQMAIGLALFCGLVAARGVTLTVRDTLLARLQHGFVQRTKMGLLRQLAAARWVDLIRRDRGALLQMLGSEMTQLAVAVNYCLALFVSSIFLAAMVAFAFWLAPAFALFTVTFMGMFAVASAIYLRRSGASGKTLLDEEIAMNETAMRFLDSIKLAKAHGLERSFLERYDNSSSAAVRQRVAFVQLLSRSRNGLMAAAAIVAVAAVATGLSLMEVKTAQLIAFVIILSRLAGPALSIQQGIQQVAVSVPQFDLARKLGRALGATTLESLAPEPVGRSIGGTRLELAGVCLERNLGPTGPGCLDDISFAIRPGEIVGLCGPSGAGKTTVLDILAGLLAPSRGVVKIGGAVMSPGRRRGIVYLGQEAALFAGSLRDNLLWFAPGKSDVEMEWAMHNVGGSELLGRTDAGLDMVLADGGGNLSAGERQRIALARGLLRGGSLFLLDEATSSLEMTSEREVIKAIRALPGRPTIILVSHRHETLSICDRVLELEFGRLQEIGSGSRPLAHAAMMPVPAHHVDASGV